MSEGIDYAWDRPDLAAAAADGKSFICRYLSHDSSKDLDISELALALSLGMSVVVVWETTAGRALEGRGAGMSDAASARERAAHIGFPLSRPIYFAVDFDASESDYPFIDEYIRGAAEVMGGPENTGAYGGYWTIRHLFDAGLIGFGWQTYAWSRGNVHPNIHIYQHENGVSAYGGTVDFNTSYKEDFGQHPTPVTQEADMAISRTHLPLTRIPETDKAVAHTYYDNSDPEILSEWINLLLDIPVTVTCWMDGIQVWGPSLTSPGDPECNLYFGDQFPDRSGHLRIEIEATGIRPGIDVAVEHSLRS